METLCLHFRCATLGPRRRAHRCRRRARPAARRNGLPRVDGQPSDAGTWANGREVVRLALLERRPRATIQLRHSAVAIFLRREAMSITFKHVPHPHIAKRKKTGPAKTTDESVGFNGKIALVLTTVVGTMWCAYAFSHVSY